MREATDNRSDEQLVAAANEGERQAFETLYYRYRDWVYSLAYRFCADEHDACDVLQETFFYFFNKFPGFELRARIKTFLYPVAKHRALDRREKQSKTSFLGEEVGQLPAGPHRDADAERRRLAERVHGLPEPQREVVLLRFADGLALREISTALGIPLGTVKSRLHQALSTLRRQIS
jgi:RNA polymerase sigma-70 factor (ECF subfamily)